MALRVEPREGQPELPAATLVVRNATTGVCVSRAARALTPSSRVFRRRAIIHIDQISSAISATAWLLLLWYAAGSVKASAASTPTADRLRTMMIVGTAIPFGLAFAGALSTASAYATLLAIIVLLRYRARRFKPNQSACEADSASKPRRDALPILVVIGVAWPPLVRPPLQGDTLWYHLPDAAAWTHPGGIWQTWTHYWWYPGGSELFAAGLIATAGPIAACLAGPLALLLLGLRVAGWLDAEGVPSWTAGAIAAALVAAAPLANEGGDLQNDVWLAAAFLEALWCGRRALPRDERRGLRLALVGAVALCSLTKPYGSIFAVAALVFVRSRKSEWFVALLPFALWVVRDAILWPGAFVPFRENVGHATPFTTILANLPLLPAALVSGFRAAGPAATIFLICGVLAAATARDRLVRLGALVTLCVFAIEPYGFRTGARMQLASGDSIRYAAPALAFGSLWLAGAARNRPVLVGTAALLLGGVELSFQLARYWFVVPARFVLAALLLAGAIAMVTRPVMRRRLALVHAFGSAAIVVAIASAAPAAFYDARLGGARGGVSLYAWLQRREPRAVVVSGLDVGPVAIVLPGARVAQPGLSDLCEEARALHGIIVSGDGEEDAGAGLFRPDQAATECGPVAYRDARSEAIVPTP